jgi:hypothetical protein
MDTGDFTLYGVEQWKNIVMVFWLIWQSKILHNTTKI